MSRAYHFARVVSRAKVWEAISAMQVSEVSVCADVESVKERERTGYGRTGKDWTAKPQGISLGNGCYLKEQRGFMGASIYVYLGLAIAAAALAGVCYLAGRSDGRAIERADWVGAQNADLRTANRALDEAHKQIRAKEQAAAEKVAAVSRGYQKDLENANRAKTTAMDALRASGGLRVAVTGCKADDAGTAETASSAGRRDGGTSTGLLDESASAFLIGEASRADAVVLQLRACQAVIKADRSF